MNNENPAPARPYRSHRWPACQRCRSRKIKCHVDTPGQQCRFCRERQETCRYELRDDGPLPSSNAISKRRRQVNDQTGRGVNCDREATLSHFPSVMGTSPTESSLMMNPHMAEDIAVLEQYLTSRTAESSAAAKSYSTISNTPGNPIVYLTVPRRRKGLNTAVDPGRMQREIIEQILSPVSDEVRRLYFERLHPCFPILDERTFLDMWQKDNHRISSSLLCDLYASALSFWSTSEKLKIRPRPDMHFIWNQAVAALQDDFMAPTISTIHAALLDMVGRPVIQVTGNIVNAGRVVTLAQSLGLHRDPTQWRATPHEKSVRIRLWWGVLIHDYWSSIGHGIPPTINPRYFDVPIPTSEMLSTRSSSECESKANTTFIELCKLSQVLGDILPIVYSLSRDSNEVWRTLRKIECALDDWAIALPEYLRFDSFSAMCNVNGASNLWFSYLSVKVLICRLAFKASLEGSRNSSFEARQYRLATLREATLDVVDFVSSLDESQLHEFWMPYTSYLLVTAATILLRCTIECGDIETKKACATRLVGFRNRLRRARTDSEWDLADFCLERCHEPIQKIANALGILTHDTQVEDLGQRVTMNPAPGTMDQVEVGVLGSDTSLSDFSVPIDSLDYPWETLWDSFEGPWSIQI